MPKSTRKDASISFEIRGYNRVANNMRKMIAAHPKDVNEVMRQWAEDTRMFLKRTHYAPKPADSRYVRTGRLASSWRKEEVKPAVWVISNNAASPQSGRFYARYVVGSKDGPADQRQTKAHFENKWWRADEEVEKWHMPELTAYLSERYLELWGSP